MSLPLYQLPLPAGLVKVGFECTVLYQNSKSARFPDGFATMTETADPYWQLNIAMPYTTSNSVVRQLRAWKASLRGGQKTFLCPYATAPHPMAYKNRSAVLALTRSGATGPFDGTATIINIVSANVIRFSSLSTLRLPGSFDMRAGDVISVVKAGARPKYSLHQIVESVTASGVGLADVTIEPRINTSIFAAGDVVNFLDPLGEFVLDPATQSDGLVSRGDNSFQISATSYLRA